MRTICHCVQCESIQTTNEEKTVEDNYPNFEAYTEWERKMAQDDKDEEREVSKLMDSFPPKQEEDFDIGLPLSEFIHLREDIATLYQNSTKLREQNLRLQHQVRKEQLNQELQTNKIVELEKQVEDLQDKFDVVTEERRKLQHNQRMFEQDIEYFKKEIERHEKYRKELVELKHSLMQGSGRYLVRLLSFGGSKIQCIKGIRDYFDLSLKEAKDWVECAPVYLTPNGVSWQAAQMLMESMTGEKVDYSGMPISDDLLPKFSVEKI